jgi:putative membrane protein
MRTSLALLASGVGLDVVALPVAEALRLACALVLIILGLLAPVQAWRGWSVTERALRESRPLPSPRLSPVMAAGTVGVGVLLLLALLLR